MNRTHRLNWNDITGNCLATLASPRQFFKKLHWFLGIAVLSLLYGCGGGTGSGSDPGPGIDLNPPTGLVYAVSSASYAQHQAITPNVPHNSGGKITDYSAEPALPVGLVLDAVTGVISGTPAEAAPAVIHTVTGSNAHGVATAYLQIEVTAAVTAPTLLHYKENPASYPVNTDINPNLPHTEGGAVTQFRSSPALPDGLHLDPSTGVISGASKVVKPEAIYVISASNAAGTVSRALTIGITDSLQPPDNLNYSQPVAVYPQGKVIAPNLPTAAGGAIAVFDVQPSLPEGLSLNTENGEISGTPSTLQAERTYTITGNNPAGSTTTTVTIAIVKSRTFYPGMGMNHARYGHTATLLPDGNVLVVGGHDMSNAALKTAELYNPSTGIWRLIESMSTPRSNHTATFLELNGKVLIAGGDVAQTTELYDPGTETWTLTENTNRVRYRHASTTLPDGTVLIAGGGASFNSVELYDPKTGIWRLTGSMDRPRHDGHIATLLGTGKVLVTGGYSPGSSNMAELYDPDAGTWTFTGRMNSHRDGYTSNTLSDGTVLAIGGSGGNGSLSTVELYDPDAETWTTKGAMNHRRSNHTSTVLNDENILVAGGYGTQLKTGELYDSKTGAWTLTGDHSPRYHHTATRLQDGKVLLAGGKHNGGVISTSELYIP
jgi:N-acetylneuraminic acid mutarotase